MLYEDEEMQQATLRRIILTAFEMDDLTGIHKVFSVSFICLPDGLIFCM